MRSSGVVARRRAASTWSEPECPRGVSGAASCPASSYGPGRTISTPAAAVLVFEAT
jgi:hypothetical protein